MTDAVRIGIVSVSDRASTGVYEDKGLPALQDWLTRALRNPIHFEPRLIPDEQQRISDTLVELVDAGPNKVHFRVQFSRYRADGSLIGSYKSFYIVTLKDGRWAIQGRSSWAE